MRHVAVIIVCCMVFFAGCGGNNLTSGLDAGMLEQGFNLEPPQEGDEAKARKQAESLIADADMDGIADWLDKCPGTKGDVLADMFGCPSGLKLSLDLPENERTEAMAQVFDGKMERIRGVLDNHPEAKIVVEAHTWDIGREKANRLYTERLARGAKDFVAERFGVEPDKIMAVGYGDTKPLASNRTVKGREANRRMNFFLLHDTEKQGKRVEMRTPEPVELRFDPYASQPSAKYMAMLAKAGEMLAAHPRLKVVVSGYTDNLGRAESNLLLSKQRADHIRDWLVEHYAVSKERIQTLGLGELDPAADNSSVEGRRRNRRVVVRFEGVVPKENIEVHHVAVADPFLPLSLETGSGTLVLCYHSFDMSSRYSMASSAFERQIDGLLQNGYRIISIQELARYLDRGVSGPDKSVVLTMDDGWKSVMKAYKVLKKRNLPFTLFLTMNAIGHPMSNSILDMKDLEELKTYSKVTFADHSYSHSPRLAWKRDRDAGAYLRFIQNDINKSKKRFKELFGRETEFFAYPYGAHNQDYTRLLKRAGFKYLFSVQPELVTAKSDPEVIPRAGGERMSLAHVQAFFRKRVKPSERMLAEKGEYNVRITPIKKSGPETAAYSPVGRNVETASVHRSPRKRPRRGTDGTLSIVAVGDIMLGSTYPAAALPPDDGKRVFEHVGPHLKGGDIVFGNLEAPLIDEGTPCKCGRLTNRCYEFRTPTRYSKLLKKGGFNSLSIANNHAFDFGLEGVSSTIKLLNSEKILPAGGKSVAHFNVRGVKVALVGFGLRPREYAYSILDVEKAESIVRNLKKFNDLVIVSFHGGAEGAEAANIRDKSEYFLSERRGNVVRFSRSVVDAGADMVLGHGPHVLRAVEVYKGKLIAYSLGNFIACGPFSTKGQRGLSVVLKAKLNAASGEFVDGELVPLRISDSGIPYVDRSGKAAEQIQVLSRNNFAAPSLKFTRSASVTSRKGRAGTSVAQRSRAVELK